MFFCFFLLLLHCLKANAICISREDVIGVSISPSCRPLSFPGFGRRGYELQKCLNFQTAPRFVYRLYTPSLWNGFLPTDLKRKLSEKRLSIAGARL